MDPEDAHSPSHQLLGLTIRSRTRIYISYVIPNVLESLVYIVQIVADCAVSYQHFKSHQSEFGWATLSLILVPPAVTCALTLTSPSHWLEPRRSETLAPFVGMQLMQMIFFPLFVIYRSSKLVFWSIEALFHDDDDEMRMECLEKAEECSTCELYRLVQAYGQSAPQIILQLFHMLTQDLFRDFQTTNVQAISLVFSAIDLAAITTIYQRFESQKQVGRPYPWSTAAQKQENILKLQKNLCFQKECLRKKLDSERTLNKFPESDKIMENFIAKNQADSTEALQNSRESLMQICGPTCHTVQVHVFDDLPNEHTDLLATHLTDDDKMKTKPAQFANHEQAHSQDEFDRVPDTPPPLPPLPHETPNSYETVNGPQLRQQASLQAGEESSKRRSKAFSQLETIKDMLLMNAQLYIKENVPRPPKMLINRVENINRERETPAPTPQSPTDDVDFFLPGPTARVVKGIQQDDFAAKTIAFFGWIAFVTMRLLSLSAFCVFYPKAFLIILAVHYLLMLAALCLESRFKGKLNRTIFYLMLAYVYIYVLLEFRVKFKHIRIWFIGYIVVSVGENLTMTMMWYGRTEFESWWFDFIFEGIIYSGMLFMATIIVYYLILKPKDVIFLVEHNNFERPREQQSETQINATVATATDV